MGNFYFADDASSKRLPTNTCQRGIRLLGAASVASLALACSGEASLEPGDVSVDVASLVDAVPGARSLSASDADLVATYLESTGRRLPTSIEGSTLYWDDMMLSLDDLVARNARLQGAVVEKGYALPGPTSVGDEPNTILFERPDSQRPYFFIVADDAPDFVFEGMEKVVAEFGSTPNDCIPSNTLFVQRQSVYDGQRQGLKDECFEVEVNFIPVTAPEWNCGSANGPKACADGPGAQPVMIRNANGQLVFDFNRQAFGDRLFFDEDTHDTAEKFENVARHELGHAFGLDHQTNTTHVFVPGTQSCGQCINEFPSIMNGGGRASFSTDDLVTLATLYTDLASRENDGCLYDPNARLLTALR